MAQTTTKRTKAAAARPSAGAKKTTKVAAARPSAGAKKTTKVAAARPSAGAKKTTKVAAAGPSAGAKGSPTAELQKALARTADLSEEVLKSVEGGQLAALKAVRKFLDTVDDVLPAIGDHPSRREAVIDAALEMADRLVTTQYDFLRNVVRSADRSLSKSGAKKK
jgi:hypothetical protein